MIVEPIPNMRTEIPAAIKTLSTEYNQINLEIDAFQEFESRVSRINPDPGTTSSISGLGYQQEVTEDRCMKVRTAYKETVMSVPHYDEEYNDTYPLSIKEEFGSDVAVALTKSMNFTSITKSALLDSVKDAINEREKLRDVVETEKKSLTTSHNSLSDIAKDADDISKVKLNNLEFGALDAYRNQITVLFENLNHIATKRQNVIHNIRNKMRSSALDANIYGYFYQNLSIRHPVLAVIGDIGKILNKLKETIHTTIIYSCFELEPT